MYLLDYSKLEVGDILLTTQKHIVSKTIKAFTISDFSHAMLHVGGGSYIHSDGNGVHSGNLQRLLFKKSKYVKVLRIIGSFNDEIKENACIYARREVGKQYSVKDAIRTKNPLSRKQSSNRQFCSRLVAQAYQNAGLQLVNNPMFCTPQELDDSSYTEEVKYCLKEATESEIEFANSDNPLEKQTQITNFMFEKFREATNSDAQTFEQLLNVLFQTPSYDKVASAILVQSGYLVLWKDELTKNPWRYNYDAFLSLPIPKEEKLEVAKNELERAKESKKRYVMQYQQLMIAWQQKQLQYLKLNLSLYEQLIKNDIDRIETMQKFIKNNKL